MSDGGRVTRVMCNAQLRGSKTFDSQILVHSITQNNDVTLDKEYQKYLSKEHQKHGVVDQLKLKRETIKENGQTYSIMFRIMLMLHQKK